jgi:hypothetical protein
MDSNPLNGAAALFSSERNQPPGIVNDIAEGFKQGAQTLEISALVEPWSAPCLKS